MTSHGSTNHAAPIIISSSTTTTVSDHQTLSNSRTDLVHTTCAAIERDILQNLPALCTNNTPRPQTDTASTYTLSTDTMSTTHAFTHIITVGYTPSNRPINAAISFNINLISTSSLASTSFPASTTITFTTTADTSTTCGTIVDNANGAPSSDADASPSIQRAAVRANVTGAVTITPSPYECASVTATFESVAEDDGSEKQRSVIKSAASGIKRLNTLMKTPRNVKAEGQRPPAPAVAEVAVAPDQPQLTTPANAEPAPNKKLALAERTAAAKADREQARAKTNLAAEVPDDSPTNWITPADARTTDTTATGTKAGTTKATTGTVKSTLKHMKTAFKTLLPTKPQNTTTYLPSATVTAILDHLLNLIPALHKKYARYDEVDAAM